MEPQLVTDSYIIETAFRRWGLSPRKIGVEFHMPCPSCGGTKRAWVSNRGRVTCRECSFADWLDSDKPNERDPEKIAVILAEQKRLEEERQKDIERRLLELRTNNPVVAYKMGRDDEARFIAKQYFNSQGIDDWLIERYSLGYVRDHAVKTDVGVMRVPAYTIPITHPVTEELVNFQYRLVSPPEGVGKYQQHYGVPSSAFYAESMPGGISGKAIVCEGAKKAIVTYDRIDAGCQVVGLPGCYPSRKILDQLLEFEHIWLCLDPGCESQENRIRSIVPQTTIVSLPGKIDDLFLSGMTKEKFKSCMQGGR